MSEEGLGGRFAGMETTNTRIDPAMPTLMEEITQHREKILSEGRAPHGVERDLVRTFLDMVDAGHFDERLPQNPLDTIVTEFSARYGRADIVIFHADGSASVIEAKDGTVGYNHVVSGIGQAALYAVQIARKDAVRRVRRCLMWTSTGDLLLDGLIEEVCESAGVVPLPFPSMKVLMASRLATETVIMARRRGE